MTRDDRRQSRLHRGAPRLLIYLLLGGVSLLFLAPLLGIAAASVTPPEELGKGRLAFFPRPAAPNESPLTPPDASAYPRILFGQADTDATDQLRQQPFDYLRYARNTLIIVALSLVGMVLSSAIAAYGFARVPFPGRNAMFAVCLATMMIPFPVLMVPTYMIFKQLGWIGTFLPLWVPAWFGSAFNIFLLRQFFLGLPQELEESALLDGCSRWGCFWRIILPLSRPALAVVALFHILFVWNDFLGPLIYLSHQHQYTLALGLQALQTKAGDTPWNELMAASLLIVIPVIILFLFAQRTFIQGIATSGLKG